MEFVIVDQEDVLTRIQSLKDEGNAHFKANDETKGRLTSARSVFQDINFSIALICYNHALMYLRGLDQSNLIKSLGSLSGGDQRAEATADVKKDITNTLATVYNNMAAVHTRRKDWEKVLRTAEECLSNVVQKVTDLQRIGCCEHKGSQQEGYCSKKHEESECS